MIKFYVAGKWEERESVRGIQGALRELGHIITVDWTWHEEEEPGFPSQYAVEDIIGASSCDIYVGLFERNHNYKGALVEMGAALSQGKIVCIIGNAIETCLFCHHPFVKAFKDTDSFLRWVK